MTKEKSIYFFNPLWERHHPKTRKKVKEFGTYLTGNWKAINNIEPLNIQGSCTEGQVSQILFERFCRNPMGWREEVLGKLIAKKTAM